MPAPLLLPLLQMGAGALSQVANMGQQSGVNKKQQKFALEQYARERRDSLADYNMQNEYNSPKAQMQRLKDAGLNPNLVYDNGATTTAASVRSADTGSYTPGMAPVDLGRSAGDAIGTYYDAQVKQQQTNNMKAAEELTRAQINNTNADTILKGTRNNIDSLGYSQASALNDVTLEAAGLSLRQKYQDYKNSITQGDALKTSIAKNKVETAAASVGIFTSLSANARAEALQQPNVTAALQSILESKSRTSKNYADIRQTQQALDNAIKDGTLKQYDIDMRKRGVDPGDPAWLRVVAKAWDWLTGSGSAPDSATQQSRKKNFDKMNYK